MSRKKQASIPNPSLPALQIGSRVRCPDDVVEGRITWANGVAVKIAWADGEKVTWKRADLPGKGLEVLEPDDADQPPVEPAAAATTPTEQPAAVAKPVRPIIPYRGLVSTRVLTVMQSTGGDEAAIARLRNGGVGRFRDLVRVGQPSGRRFEQPLEVLGGEAGQAEVEVHLPELGQLLGQFGGVHRSINARSIIPYRGLVSTRTLHDG
jgi:hypothetical protein